MTERDFKAFNDRNRANFQNFARVMARRNEVVAGDAFADALASVWMKFGNKPLTEEIETHMRGYTFQCMKNFVLKWYRDSKTRGKLFHAGLDGAAENVADITNACPERMMELLDEMLSNLPPKFEAAVRLCCLKNPPVSQQEAAGILGVSMATLYRMLNEAKNMLGKNSENVNYQISLPKGAIS